MVDISNLSCIIRDKLTNCEFAYKIIQHKKLRVLYMFKKSSPLDDFLDVLENEA